MFQRCFLSTFFSKIRDYDYCKFEKRYARCTRIQSLLNLARILANLSNGLYGANLRTSRHDDATHASSEARKARITNALAPDNFQKRKAVAFASKNNGFPGARRSRALSGGAELTGTFSRRTFRRGSEFFPFLFPFPFLSDATRGSRRIVRGDFLGSRGFSHFSS